MRKGFDGLSAQVRNILLLDPFSGAAFLFRGKKGTVRNFVCGRAFKHYACIALMKRSPKITAY